MVNFDIADTRDKVGGSRNYNDTHSKQSIKKNSFKKLKWELESEYRCSLNNLSLIVFLILYSFVFHSDKVTKIREQCQKQEETIREQETELDSKKGELQKLKDEESTLEKEYDENKRLLEKLSQTLQDTQLQICQVNEFGPFQFINSKISQI